MADSRKLPGPESIADLVMVSSPHVDPKGRRVFYVVTKVDLDSDRYESSIWMYDASMGRVVLQSGPGDSCPVPGPYGVRYVFIRRPEGRRGRKARSELRVSTVGSSGSQLLMRALHFGRPSWSPEGRYLVVPVAEGEPHEDVKIIDDLPVWFNGRGWVYNTQVKPYIVDSETGIGEPIDLGSKWVQVDSVAWSPDGSRIAVVARTDRLKPYLADLYIVDVETREARPVLRGFSGSGEIAWSPDGKRLALLAHWRERGFATHNRVYVVDPETGEKECLTCSLGLNASGWVNSDVRGPSCSPEIAWTQSGILFTIARRGAQLLYSARPGGEPEPLIDPGEGVIDEFSASISGGLIAYTAMSSVEPKDLYVYRAGTVERVTRVGESWSRRYRLARVVQVGFKASDGVEIDGWLYHPPEGVEEKGWILYIHGGPKTMWGHGFMHEFHVLAARGYVVAAFNPRGSDGYSEEFADIRCRYGERDYMDLMEAYDYLVNSQGLPADKAAVMGGSYGGFMTNWIVGNTDRFKAAVTMRSCSNWISMYGTSDIGWYFVEDQLCCTPWRNPEKCWEKSPLRLADRVKTPILIIHSSEDYRCWLDQAIQWFTALKTHGAKARLAVFPGENHDLSRSGKPKHRVERLKLILSWLDEHLSSGGKEGEKAEEG